LPQSVKKALLIDSDIIVLDSLKELYETDIDKFVFAAAIPHNAYYHHKKYGNLYLNIGVTLYNVKKYNEERVFERLISELVQADLDEPAPDETLLANLVVDKEKYPILPRYNVLDFNTCIPPKSLKIFGNFYYNYFEESFWEDALKNPAVLHFNFIDLIRPWLMNKRPPKYYKKYFAIYYDLLKETPFSNHKFSPKKFSKKKRLDLFLRYRIFRLPIFLLKPIYKLYRKMSGNK
jgi:lipopolysaccharide biosynthesis glycosyltransferase